MRNRKMFLIAGVAFLTISITGQSIAAIIFVDTGRGRISTTLVNQTTPATVQDSALASGPLTVTLPSTTLNASYDHATVAGTLTAVQDPEESYVGIDATLSLVNNSVDHGGRLTLNESTQSYVKLRHFPGYGIESVRLGLHGSIEGDLAPGSSIDFSISDGLGDAIAGGGPTGLSFHVTITTAGHYAIPFSQTSDYYGSIADPSIGPVSGVGYFNFGFGVGININGPGSLTLDPIASADSLTSLAPEPSSIVLLLSSSMSAVGPILRRFRRRISSNRIGA